MLQVWRGAWEEEWIDEDKMWLVLNGNKTLLVRWLAQQEEEHIDADGTLLVSVMVQLDGVEVCELRPKILTKGKDGQV